MGSITRRMMLYCPHARVYEGVEERWEWRGGHSSSSHANTPPPPPPTLSGRPLPVEEEGEILHGWQTIGSSSLQVCAALQPQHSRSGSKQAHNSSSSTHHSTPSLPLPLPSPPLLQPRRDRLRQVLPRTPLSIRCDGFTHYWAWWWCPYHGGPAEEVSRACFT